MKAVLKSLGILFAILLIPMVIGAVGLSRGEDKCINDLIAEGISEIEAINICEW